MLSFFFTAHFLPRACRHATVLTLILAATALTVHARGLVAMTGRVLPNDRIHLELPMVRTGDKAYAEVNSAWLKKFYHDYRAKLAELGIVKWDDRYDCRRFAGMFTELAQTAFFVEAFHDSTPAHTLALGPVWYQRSNGRGGHAIIVAFTERGRIFLDPQSGDEVQLTQAEQKSIYLAVL